MNYRRIHIIGAPGSGKSFCAKQLSTDLNVDHYELDKLFWDHESPAYGLRAAEPVRTQELDKIVNRDSWIIDGVYYKWWAASFDRADLIVVLLTPLWLRQYRIIIRFILRRLGFIESKYESFSSLLELIKWNQNFDNDNLIRIRKFIAKYSPKTHFCYDADEIKQLLSSTN